MAEGGGDRTVVVIEPFVVTFEIVSIGCEKADVLTSNNIRLLRIFSL